MKSSTDQFETLRNNCLFLFRNKVKIHLSEIILLEGETNYTHLHLQNGKKVTIARTLKVFEKALDTYQFYRIHRAYLINKKHLISYDYILGEVVLTNEHRKTTSRRRKINFEQQIFN